MKVVRRFVFVVCMVLVFVNGLHASETRIRTMGYLANFYIRDSYNIWQFPSMLTSYKNLIIIDSYLGDGLWSGGIHLPLSDTFTMGVYMNNRTRDLSFADTQFLGRGLYYTNLSPDAVYANTASHQFTAFAALQLNALDLGLHVTSYSSKHEYTDPDIPDNNLEENLSDREYRFGIGYKMNERTRLDAAIFYTQGDFSRIDASLDTAQTREPDGYNSFGAGVRLFYAYSPKVIIIPFIGYEQGGEGYLSLMETGSGNIKSYRNTWSQYVAGIAADILPGENTLITIAGGFAQRTDSFEQTWYTGTPPVSDEEAYIIFPFFSVGLEAKLFKWMGARFSFYELLNAVRIKEAVTNTLLDERRITGSMYAANFGLYFRLGRFTIDTLVDTDGAADFLHNGPYVLSGIPSSLFTQISVIFNFNK